MSLGILDLFAVSITALATALLFWGLKWAFLKSNTQQRLIIDENASPISFLLEGDAIVDCTSQADLVLTQCGDGTRTAHSVLTLLEPMFPDLGEAMSRDKTTLQTVIAQDNSSIWLEVLPIENRIRISMKGQCADPKSYLNAIRISSENVELAELREITRNAPQLMWRTNATGNLVWANDAYLAACDGSADLSTNIPRMPSKPLFGDLEQPGKMGITNSRCSVKLRDEEDVKWYDVTALRTETGVQHFANDANSVVRAEQGQRKFVQTLSQTFAQLSIGLAIFDRRRQLATFNPALLDMTTLPFEFLSGRPSLDTLLDRLRELRMLPEPKNYTSWREQFSAMEQAAKDGTYSENWNLPDGQTFQVTGRPHPDGAFALLFEDISAEISLTRRFRSEIETSQAVLDTMADAIAVFSSGGNLVLANEQYAQLWETDLDSGLGRHDLRVELRKWQSRCTPTKIWTNLKEFTNQLGLRQTWTNTAIFDDGRQITCEAVPIKGGMTLIRFRFDAAQKPLLTQQKNEAAPYVDAKKLI